MVTRGSIKSFCSFILNQMILSTSMGKSSLLFYVTKVWIYNIGGGGGTMNSLGRLRCLLLLNVEIHNSYLLSTIFSLFTKSREKNKVHYKLVTWLLTSTYLQIGHNIWEKASILKKMFSRFIWTQSIFTTQCHTHSIPAKLSITLFLPSCNMCNILQYSQHIL